MGELESGGRDDIPVSALLLLAEVFNVPLTELVTGGGMVRLGATERPLDLVARMLRGEPPLDPGLVGPSEIPGMDPAVHGRGPYWVRTAGRASYVYSAMEVRAARLLDIFVEDVHEASQARWGRIIDLELARHVDEKDPEPRRQQVEQQLIDELASSPELMQRLRARAQGR